MSVIEAFKEVLSNHTDVPDLLKEIAVLTAISGVVGKRALIFYEPKVKVFTSSTKSDVQPSGMYLNIYTMVIGESRVTRKSTVLNFLKDLIEAVNGDLLIAQIFTPEALLEELREKERLLTKQGVSKEVQAIWLVDEAARFFEFCQ